ncbi:hypothetical protein [Abyssibius alkaniclasticus]|uniref:hypothetical protein n=1 Tax=Abyssibius alkaniclasticus TaxID=2881234 RepID=UPI0040580F20
MSLIRPKARERLSRWIEPLALAAAMLLALRLAWLGIARGAWVLVGLGLVLAAVLGVLIYLAILRASLARRLAAVGLVEVDERRITYLAPSLGGSLDLDDLRRVALSTGRGGTQSWVLYAPDQTPLVIPLGAEGADILPDTFAALPGLSLATLLRSVAAARPGMESIWEKQR